MTDSVLDRFRPQVATWFRDVFERPTAVQAEAWQRIADGHHALVIAPTGSGKTLAAFLWALNALVEPTEQAELPLRETHHPGATPIGDHGVKVLYISPLKALGVDVENNLRAPLTGIARTAERLGLDMPSITVGVRSGDTPPAERARQVRTPPDILITTPESAYLMLTSKAKGILTEVTTVIVDEIHALAGSKRGSHLALTLERLSRLVENNGGTLQRIGLSATVRPPEAVASFLGGDRPVEIVAPPSTKEWELQVRVPVEDMANLPAPEPGSRIGDLTIDDRTGLSADAQPEGAGESALPTQGSMWPFIERELYEDIMGARSTLVFVNSRRSAERLTSRLNELWALDHDPEALSAPRRRDPAQLMKSVDVAGQAPQLIARAHHGSVSKDERAETERLLKEGKIKAVVATSSLELGIDMGAVDLVVQVESPPSVASGLQRVGRAGHGVGRVSHGVFYPKHRADVLNTAVIAQRMRAGQIEELQVPRNALDVLAQQTIAAVAVEDIDVEEWWYWVRRADPYRELPRSAFDAVMDLVSGVYPSTDFAELRPRVNFDRVSGQLSARPGAQRVAVTSGGTIPDRGMFGVFLVGQEEEKSPRRVGELDEEMVYECRVGDTFTLGASSWRIEEITKDHVMVSPAPGHTGRLPFWNGDDAGRPAELGRAVGAFRREVAANPSLLEGMDLDENARQNIRAFLAGQEEATGIVPDERTLVLERFRDEVGDWRLVLHTPYGRAVNAAWALAVGARMSQEKGIDAQPVSGDDGIVLRVPEGEEIPSAALFHLDPEEARDLIVARVGDSALFASRFRECAARALLLPRTRPGKRAPLWQQRQRAAQLLDVARRYPSFPIILETVRECLHDVYDLDALGALLRDLEQRRVRIAEVTVDQPSPFAASLLFTYTGAFMYEGDSPLAEKRAAALSLDPELLRQLLGDVELRNLLDPELIEEVHAELQHAAPGRQARHPEELVDVLRATGPIPVAELERHCAFADPLARTEQETRGRVMRVRIAEREHLAIVEDAPLLRDGLGIPVPPGVPAATETVPDALEQLVGRCARSRGPVTAREVGEIFGLGVSAAHTVLQGLTQRGDLVEGHFRQGCTEREFCARHVLKILRSRGLAQARSHMQPISTTALARFLTQWHGIARVGGSGELSGVDGTFAAIEQLAGVRLPASAWESMILPSRVADYQPDFLDELTRQGEVFILGAGSAGAQDPWIMLLPADYAEQLTPILDEEPTLSPIQRSILDVLGRGGAYHVSDILHEVTATMEEARAAMWDLVEVGLVSPDSMEPIRVRLSQQGRAGSRAHRTRRRPQRTRLRMGRTSFHQQVQAASTASTPPDLRGRWSLAPFPDTDSASRSLAHGEAWLDRYGVVTRGSIVAEDTPGGFSMAYRILSNFEDHGRALRGYLVDGLGAAQFSTPAIIDRLRGLDDSPDAEGWPSGSHHPEVVLLAAVDPANPYGASIPWTIAGAQRAAGALVVLCDGVLMAYLSRGGRTLRLGGEGAPLEKPEVLRMAIAAVQDAVSRGRMEPFTVESIDGEDVLQPACAQLISAAGLRLTPRGISIRRQPSSPGMSRRSNRGPAPRRGRSMTEALSELSDSPTEGQGPGAPGLHERAQDTDIPRGPRGVPQPPRRWTRR